MNAISLARVLALTLALLCAAPGLAHAANCTSPAGAEGAIIYNADHHLLQFCNGTAWVGLVGGGSGGGGADNLGNHTAIQNIILDTNWLSGDGGNEGIRIDSAGRVGIGIASPTEAFEVAGRVKAVAYHNSSDRRLKHDIASLEGEGINLVRKLRGVSFVWNDSRRQAMGFIAQEIEPIVPYAVATDAKGYKSVDYVMLIAPMAEAVKTLDAGLTKANAAIDALKADNAALRAVLEQLAQQQARDRADTLKVMAEIQSGMQ